MARPSSLRRPSAERTVPAPTAAGSSAPLVGTKGRAALLALLILLPLAAMGASQKALNKVVAEQQATEKAAQRSQEKIDRLADRTEAMLAEYKLALAQRDALERYNDQLEKLVASQNRELEALTAQLSEIDTTQQGVLPLLARMLDALEKFIALDLPFLPEERQGRLAELRALMDRADLSLAEKFRRVLEAYQIELDYGRTLEAYTGELESQGERRSVEFLRLGRLVLLYQTLDQQETARWDPASGRWQPLDPSYRKWVRQGLRMARKQVPPDLLKLPVPAPQEAP